MVVFIHGVWQDSTWLGSWVVGKKLIWAISWKIAGAGNLYLVGTVLEGVGVQGYIVIVTM